MVQGLDLVRAKGSGHSLVCDWVAFAVWVLSVGAVPGACVQADDPVGIAVCCPAVSPFQVAYRSVCCPPVFPYDIPGLWVFQVS